MLRDKIIAWWTDVNSVHFILFTKYTSIGIINFKCSRRTKAPLPGDYFINEKNQYGTRTKQVL